MAAVKAGAGLARRGRGRGDGAASRRPCGPAATRVPERSVRSSGVEAHGGHRRQATPTADAARRGRPRRTAPSPTTRRRGGRRSGRRDRGRRRPSTSRSSAELVRRRSSDDVDDGVPADLRLVVGKTPGVTSDDHVAEAGRKVMRFHLARMLAREAGHPRRPRPRGAPRDARRDPPAAGGLARVRRVVPRRPDEALPQRPARDRRRGSGPSATSTSCSRRPTSTAPTCRSPSSARSSRCSPTGASIATTPGSCSSASSTPTATGAGSTTTATSSGPRAPRSCRSGRRSRTASATRPRRGSGPPTSRSAATSRSCAGPTSRRSTSCGSPASGCATRSSSSARRSATTPAPLIARVTALQDHLGLMNDADVSASMARTFLVEHAGDLSRARERRDRALPRQPRARGRPPAAHDRRAVAGRGGRHVPAHARAGGRRACSRAETRACDPVSFPGTHGLTFEREPTTTSFRSRGISRRGHARISGTACRRVDAARPAVAGPMAKPRRLSPTRGVSSLAEASHRP